MRAKCRVLTAVIKTKKEDKWRLKQMSGKRKEIDKRCDSYE